VGLLLLATNMPSFEFCSGPFEKNKLGSNCPSLVTLQPENQTRFEQHDRAQIGKRILAMNQTVFYEAFDLNPITCNYDLWVGTGLLAAILQGGFKPDLSYPFYGNESDAVEDWACKGRH
jgi:hypothetical protein